MDAHQAVIAAVARKAQRLSQEVELLARRTREYIGDDDAIKAMWRAQRELHKLSERLQKPQ